MVGQYGRSGGKTGRILSLLLLIRKKKLFGSNVLVAIAGVCVCKSVSRVRLFVTPWTIQSMEFSRPEFWSGQPFPSLEDLSNSGTEPRSPALQADSLPTEPQGKPKNATVGSLSLLQGFFPTKELKQSLLHCRLFLSQMSYQGSPISELLIR